MSSNRITENGPTEWLFINSNSAHVALTGSFGGGTVTVEQSVNGAISNLLDSQVAITSTASDDYKLNVSEGDKIRLNMAGATSPSVDWAVGGASKAR